MTSVPPALTARNLDLPGLRHAFFTREGGVSDGVYASLNGGVGSRDAAARVAENRARMAARVGVEAERLLVPFQIHSADALVVDEPWGADARPRCDGLVTREASLALGVTGADCGMLLFADARAGVIGACHAGWKGALTGMIEATVIEMEAQGARRADIHVALGPAIGATSYEVGPEFIARFGEADRNFARFFAPSTAKAMRCSIFRASSPRASKRSASLPSRMSASTLTPMRRAVSPIGAACIGRSRITAGSSPRSRLRDYFVA